MKLAFASCPAISKANAQADIWDVLSCSPTMQAPNINCNLWLNGSKIADAKTGTGIWEDVRRTVCIFHYPTIGEKPPQGNLTAQTEFQG